MPGPQRIHRHRTRPTAHLEFNQLVAAKALHQPAWNRCPAKPQLCHFHQHQVTRRRPYSLRAAVFIGADDARQTQLPVLLQGVRVNLVQGRQWVSRRDKQRDLRALLHRGEGKVRRVGFLFLDKRDLRPATLHQCDQVFAFRDQAFQLKVRVALLEGREGDLESIGLVSIGHGETQLRLQALR